jgi:hypothetical protein
MVRYEIDILSLKNYLFSTVEQSLRFYQYPALILVIFHEWKIHPSLIFLVQGCKQSVDLLDPAWKY